jgi:catechol 2,3-dioxygenase-like lactoylglutathione lyase family enzyme
VFRKVDAIILLVSDMKRSVDFYKNVLGLPLKTRSRDWVEFFKDGTTLALHPYRRKKKTPVGALVGFMVSSMDETYAELRKRKVRFLKKPAEESFGKHAIILDPDGYMISIVQLKVKVPEEVDLFGALGIE